MPVSTAQDLAPPGVGIAPRRWPGDPLRDAVVERRLAVEAGRDLEPQPGPAPRHAGNEADVEFAGLASMRPEATSMPAAANRARPCPATSGFGSRIATTARATPAAIRASAQGGVRPKWLQGSSVT
jgi:hypothetical protein